MKLTLSQAKALILSPKNKSLIEKGKRYESTLRILTEEKTREELAREEAWTCFLDNLKSKISARKYERLLAFIKYPLPVVNIGKGVLTDIYKIFDGMNSYFHTEFLNQSNKATTEDILNEINVHKWLVHEGKEALKNEPNKIILVDKGLDGKPYLVEICSSRLIDVCVKDDSTCEYVIFIHSITVDQTTQVKTKIIGVYDDESYKLFKQTDGGDYIFLEEIAHGIGYCPARMLLNGKLNSEDEFNRSAPLSSVISALEEWQQFDIYTYYTDHYASFPVTEVPEEDCSVQNCENGFVYEETISGDEKSRKYHECPVCSQRKMIGPGSEIVITPKVDKDDVDSAGIFKFVNPDVENLEYLHKKLKDIETSVYLKTVGENEVLKQAVNEDQLQGSFEAKKSILLFWKTGFDEAYKWTVQTIILTYNAKTVAEVYADFGTEFYLMSEDDLQKRFDTAKKSGMPAGEIDMIYKQLISTKYRTNPYKMERMMILNALDPLPYDTDLQAQLKLSWNVISEEDLVIKTNLISFVNRFEMENGSIVEFGKGIDLAKKINIIKQTFKSYINVKPKATAEPIPTGGQ